MSTPNFRNQRNFSLYIQAYEPEEDYDEFEEQVFYDDILEGYDGFKDVMKNFNDTLVFHKIVFMSGYYEGLQLYVEEEAENPRELDNEDCRYYYNMCRSQAIRKYSAEIRKINRWMDKIAPEYGWKKLRCIN